MIQPFVLLGLSEAALALSAAHLPWCVLAPLEKVGAVRKQSQQAIHSINSIYSLEEMVRLKACCRSVLPCDVMQENAVGTDHALILHAIDEGVMRSHVQRESYYLSNYCCFWGGICVLCFLFVSLVLVAVFVAAFCVLLHAFCFLLHAFCFLLSGFAFCLLHIAFCCLRSAFCVLFLAAYGLLASFCFWRFASSCLLTTLCFLLAAFSLFAVCFFFSASCLV